MANPTDEEQPLRTQALCWNDASYLLAALNAAQSGTWSWDLDSGEISWSEGVHALFGLDAGQPLPDNLDNLGSLSFEDWPKAQRAFQEVINGTARQKFVHHRIRWPDGSLHWLEVRGVSSTPKTPDLSCWALSVKSRFNVNA